MKHSLRTSLSLAALLAASTLGTHAGNPAPGYIDFGKLSPGDSGNEFVEVNINSNLISMVAGLANKNDPEVAEVLKGLHSIRVNVIGLSDDNREDIQARIKDVRTRLDTQGWERIVTVQQKKEDVGIFIKTRGPEAVEGLVITVIDGDKQAVLINIVGDIRLDRIGMLGDRFNLDPLKKVSKSLEKKSAEKDE